MRATIINVIRFFCDSIHRIATVYRTKI